MNISQLLFTSRDWFLSSDASLQHRWSEWIWQRKQYVSLSPLVAWLTIIFQLKLQFSGQIPFSDTPICHVLLVIHRIIFPFYPHDMPMTVAQSQSTLVNSTKSNYITRNRHTPQASLPRRDWVGFEEAVCGCPTHGENCWHADIKQRQLTIVRTPITITITITIVIIITITINSSSSSSPWSPSSS